ncbi:outer membrane chaperone Skp (OmpH) [Paludibacter propionicigenes WB4]|uniref:Outer membrane chaperone Skp (OmpH) n=1 Tax=Paludibacter propionicigenes (strain DSM 17365 / JCM 13257 / WB4) TaxID=694427 RepID=E4T0E8_PALPW|nr:OmpH family outer membrane protein [Paludibacter propionicigenes]ADQ78307.1 outer membrane chaperone Skp (OmpH) [Paludibacter propionicigenes WB4]
MKNLSLIINAVLAVAIVVLFVLVLSNKSNSATKHAVTGKDTIISGKLPIAYVNVDSLLLHYQFAKDANESLIKKQEESRATINSKAVQLKGEMDEFQRKLNNNAFLSRDRAEQEQARLQKKQQELQELDGNLSKQLMQIQQKMSEQLRDTINVFMKQFNKDHKYQLIISNTSSDNVLYADKGYDITEEVTKALNERYAAKK